MILKGSNSERRGTRPTSGPEPEGPQGKDVMEEETRPDPAPPFQRRPGPLGGLAVVELAGIGPGPFAAMVLADLGADVIRIERPAPDPLRLPPERDATRRGKRSLVLDLKSAEGREAALALIARADVLIEGYRPGVAERLGLGPETALARNPRLIYGRMTGFGQDGPLAQSAGHDLTYLATAGVLGALGRPPAPPAPPLNLIADYGGGGMLLLVGLLAALFERSRSGRGQVVDAAMVEGVALLSTVFHALRGAGRWGARGTNLLDGGAPFYDVYPAADGKFVAVAALEPKFFAEFAARLGLPEEVVARQYDRDSWPALRAAIAARFATRNRDEWIALFEGSDACVSGVYDFGEAPHHPHNQARGVFYTDENGVALPAPAPRFSRTPPPLPSAPRPPGADGAAILAALGLTPARLAAADGPE